MQALFTQYHIHNRKLAIQKNIFLLKKNDVLTIRIKLQYLAINKKLENMSDTKY